MPTKAYKVSAILVYSAIKPEAPIHTSVMLLRDYLRKNLTDPLAGSRGEEYVYTNYPSRDVEYPHVIIYQTGGNGRRAGGNAWIFDFFMGYTIDTLHKNVADLDEITDDLIKTLIAGMPAFHDLGFQRPEFLALGRWNPMPGVVGVHRKTTELTFHMHIS